MAKAKILVVGAGSIGTRHMRNLGKLGYEVFAVDIKPENLKRVSKIAKDAFSRVKDGLSVSPQVALICTYSNAHIQIAIECARAGCHLFIEKPLSLNLDGIQELIKVIKDKNLISMVGCNLRFHPAIKRLNDLLQKHPAFNKQLLSHLEFGYYLPFAKDKYASSYQANRYLGGNLIFDCIHELDYAVWFFGNPARVFCTKGIVSSLKIDTEDYVEMIIEFKSGVLCTIHMDYLQHSYSRRCKIVCEEGTVLWDFVMGKVGICTKEKGRWQWEDMKIKLYYNKMYVDELKYFLNSVKTGRETFNSVENAVRTLKLALAAEKSCVSKRWEYVNAR